MTRRITGIEAFDGLPIDADIWEKSHYRHHHHRLLHHTTAHRPGIVFGLDVFISSTNNKELIVAPGVAIDDEGNVLLVTNARSYPIPQSGQSYLTLSYQANFDSDVLYDDGKDHRMYRLVEGRTLEVSRTLPTESYIELARVDRKNETNPIREAKNPFDPAEDELNLLYRRAAFPNCFADGGVGEITLQPKEDPTNYKPNRAGLWNFIREANGQGFHLHFTGQYNLRAPDPNSEPLILYVAGSGDFQTLKDQQLANLNTFLKDGGLLIGEARKNSKPFETAFTELATTLGATLGKVDKGHPILTAHSLFLAPPAGANEGAVTADLDAGVVLSTCDFGGAWQAEFGKGAVPDSRDRIRNSIEFGLNLVAVAARRRRKAELSRMQVTQHVPNGN